jgi:hypothetical protein
MASLQRLMVSGMAGLALFMSSNAHAAYITSEAGYHGSQISANFRTISGAAQSSKGDDEFVTFTLPFAFTFYGQNYAAGSIGWVSFNGLLGFDMGNAADYCCNSSMSYGSPTNTVQAGWFDLYGTLFMQTNGAAGNRELVFTWDANEFDENGIGARNRFQAILHESSSDIEFQYDQLNNLLHYASVGGIRGDETTVGLDFVDFSQNLMLSNLGLWIHYDPEAANDMPEPGSVALLGLGLGGLALARRKSKHAAMV